MVALVVLAVQVAAAGINTLVGRQHLAKEMLAVQVQRMVSFIQLAAVEVQVQ
jgi:hypothetical protein